MSTTEPRRCACGHDKTHVMVSAAGEYTIGGWFLLAFGITARPSAIRFQCRRCDVTLERTTDARVIATTRVWS